MLLRQENDQQICLLDKISYMTTCIPFPESWKLTLKWYLVSCVLKEPGIIFKIGKSSMRSAWSNRSLASIPRDQFSCNNLKDHNCSMLQRQISIKTFMEKQISPRFSYLLFLLTLSLENVVMETRHMISGHCLR